MSDYITLLGAEDVRAAGRLMSSAAESMRSAADTISYALSQHQRFMDDWLSRLEAVLERKTVPQ